MSTEKETPPTINGEAPDGDAANQSGPIIDFERIASLIKEINEERGRISDLLDKHVDELDGIRRDLELLLRYLPLLHIKGKRKIHQSITLLYLVVVLNSRTYSSAYNFTETVAKVPSQTFGHAFRRWTELQTNSALITESAARLGRKLRSFARPQRAEVFGHVTQMLSKVAPEDFGRQIALRVGVGRWHEKPMFPLPNLAHLSLRGIPEDRRSVYAAYWKKSHQAFLRVRSELKRKKKIMGSFNQAWAGNKRLIDRVLAEAAILARYKHNGASVAWACCAFEIFLSRVVVRALIRGFGMEGSMAKDILDDFFNRNAKASRVKKMLKKHTDIKLPDEWREYTTIVELRNDIIHGGIHVNPRQAARSIDVVSRMVTSVCDSFRTQLPGIAT